MFERLFSYPGVLARHREGPFPTAREEFLLHCSNQGMARESLHRVARELLVVARRLKISSEGDVSHQQIAAAADCWARHQRRRGRSRELKWSRASFVQVATAWLSFLGRLEAPEPKRSRYTEMIERFALYMRDERGLSPCTIRARCWHVEKFLAGFAAQSRSFAQVAISDVDGFLELLGKKGWCRVSIASSAEALRSFFRYAEQNGWCDAGIAAGVIGPRVFKHEGLPVGPDWSDVEHLIGSTSGNTPRDMRDNAILKLFAIYGFRSGEVAKLRLEDLNWAQDRIVLRRPKQRHSQEYPLLPSVGEAILRYLQQARPQSASREVFLTSRAPIQPLSAAGLYNVVSSRLKALEIVSLRHGPHALRHACAGRLVAQGLSLKEIGDHLGHRSAYATRVYAKVDLAGLRDVANFSLGGLL